MANHTVIAEAGLTIVQLLRDQIEEEIISQPEQIGLGSPGDSNNLKLSIFLYNIRESGEFRQNQMVARGTNQIQHPPMTVELFYLMTAKSTAEIQHRSVDESQILGRAMQILYDHSIIRGNRLVGSLGESNEELRIKFDNVPTDIMMRLWNFPSIPYRLSVSYSVGPIYIDSTRIKTTKRVRERDITIQG